MNIHPYEFKIIDILVDENKNIVIFPESKANYLVEVPLGTGRATKMVPTHRPVPHPIEVTYPFTIEDLASKIEYGFDQWEKHRCYPKSKHFETEYYGITGFNNAMKGKRYIHVSYGDDGGFHLSLSIPCKGRTYRYLGIEKGTILPADTPL
ncbi:MAG: hypothetical protein IJF53_03585, partial [Clostridia bacterium]|nr:hypothetical protein [Clostridia bacterium]